MAYQVTSKIWDNLGQREVKVSLLCVFQMIRELWPTSGTLLAAQEQLIVQPIWTEQTHDKTSKILVSFVFGANLSANGKQGSCKHLCVEVDCRIWSSNNSYKQIFVNHSCQVISKSFGGKSENGCPTVLSTGFKAIADAENNTAYGCWLLMLAWLPCLLP